MEVIGQRHAPAASPPLPILEEAGWATEPVCDAVQKRKFLCLCLESNPFSP
jgi:hypothetical protein